jgi:hypothetical protein
MLEKAMARIGDEYQEFLEDAESVKLENDRNQSEPTAIWKRYAG